MDMWMHTIVLNDVKEVLKMPKHVQDAGWVEGSTFIAIVLARPKVFIYLKV